MGLGISLLNVRRSIFIEASPARVWREFESFEHLREWFGLGHTLHEYVPALGGQVDLSVGIEGEPRHFGGKIVVFDPGHELSFENNWQPPNAWPVPTFFTLRLSAVYDGTMVEIFHHGFDRLGAEAADNLEGYEEGWGMNHLKALRQITRDARPI